MAVKAKYIKDLPLKENLEGTDSLILQDDEGTKRSTLEVIGDKIAEEANKRVDELEKELVQTNAQLSDIKTMVENTTSIDDSTIAIDKTWSSSKTQSMIESIPKGAKGDKGDPGTTSWNDLQDKPNIPSIEGLATESYVNQEIEKTNTRIEELFQSVSNGKELLASALTDKGIPTLASESFEEMARKILSLGDGEVEELFNLITKNGDNLITKSGDNLIYKGAM